MEKSHTSQQIEKRRNGRGQSITEVIIGGMVLVPVVLAIIDLAVVVIGGEIVNDLAKQAARAAANSVDGAEANTAVQDVVKTFSTSPTYKNLTLSLDKYDGTHDGQTTVLASVTVVLPVPVPFLNVGPTIALKTQATEAIVGIAPPRPN